MTNDTKAPERIWAAYTDQVFDGVRGITVSDKPSEGHVKFIPEQDALALAAAAVAHPQDAQAALEARDERVREEALREAVTIIENERELRGAIKATDGMWTARTRILALIEGDTDE